MEVWGGGKPGVMSEIDTQAQLRICDLEGQIDSLADEFICLREENFALRMLLWKYQIDREYSEPVSSVPQSSIH